MKIDTDPMGGDQNVVDELEAVVAAADRSRKRGEEEQMRTGKQSGEAMADAGGAVTDAVEVVAAVAAAVAAAPRNEDQRARPG
jgi:hypothetical protein